MARPLITIFILAMNSLAAHVLADEGMLRKNAELTAAVIQRYRQKRRKKSSFILPVEHDKSEQNIFTVHYDKKLESPPHMKM